MNPFKAIANFFRRIFAPLPKQPVSPIVPVNKEPPKPMPNLEAKPLPQVPSEPPAIRSINLVVFINGVQSRFGKLKSAQVDGFIYILREWELRGHTDLRWLAYIFATAWHETNVRPGPMVPIPESGGEHYLKSKKYYPYYGRGYVQLTWDFNYAKYGIAETPELALDPEFAAHVIVDGMVNGVFVPGQKLSRYFNAHTNDPVGARHIINGNNKDDLIAGYHHKFLEALKASNILDEKPLSLG